MERCDGGRGVAVLVDGKALDLGLRTRTSFERVLPEADVRISRGDLPDLLHAMLSHRPSILLVVGREATAAAAMAVLGEACRLLATLTAPRVALATWTGWGPSFSAAQAAELLDRLPAFRPVTIAEGEVPARPLAFPVAGEALAA